MIQNNNKGFTLIELLGAIVILGILGTLVIASTTKYLQSSRDKSYYMMSQSVYEATENCLIDNKCKLNQEITTDSLIKMGYIDNLKNPISSKGDCSGNVNIYIEDNDSNFNFKNYKYEVELKCDGFDNTTLIWPDAKKENKNGNNTPY